MRGGKKKLEEREVVKIKERKRRRERFNRRPM